MIVGALTVSLLLAMALPTRAADIRSDVYLNVEAGEVVTVTASTLSDETAAKTTMAKVNVKSLNATMMGFRITEGGPLDPELLHAWNADDGQLFTGTYDSHPDSDFCSACVTLVIVARRGETVTSVSLISTTDPIPDADVQTYADFTGKVISGKIKKGETPKGFTLAPDTQ
ncbi:MAG: hypothetical protein ACR2OU_17180 [Thermomicrobiales bacterium]